MNFLTAFLPGAFLVVGLVVIGLVIFLSEKFGMAAALVARIFDWQSGATVSAVALAVLSPIISAFSAMDWKHPLEFQCTWTTRQTALHGAGTGAALALIPSIRVSPFQYSQH